MEIQLYAVAHALHGFLLRGETREELLLFAHDRLEMRGDQVLPRWRRQTRSRPARWGRGA